MGIQAVLTDTSVWITLVFALGDIAMCAKATHGLLRTMDAARLKTLKTLSCSVFFFSVF